MGKRKRSGSFSKTDDSSARKSDDCDSQEEMELENLSVLKGNIPNGVRCSARVQEKQEKLRRESSPSKQTVPEVGCTAASSGLSQICVPKYVRPLFLGVQTTEEVCLPPVHFEQYNNNASSNSCLQVGSEEKRKKRNWELWSQDDKKLFFEALNEYGKDFDAIQNYIANKLKTRNKAGQCVQFVSKNKDQVRHFYYRTWNKISQYLQFPKDMKKAFQELYGLVNYGELRKKQRVLNQKSAVKLSELMEKGTTTIKVRGKTCRIKTPLCRALKRLNRVDDTEQFRMPCKIELEIIPRDEQAWTTVQRVSHNPRVKVFVPLQKTLASIIQFFEERWRSPSEKMKQELSHTLWGKPIPRMRFIPVEKRELHLPLFKVSEATNAAKISLRSYTENVLHREREESELRSKKLKRKRKQLHCHDGFGSGASGSLNGNEATDSVLEADVSDADCQDPPCSADLNNCQKGTPPPSSSARSSPEDQPPTRISLRTYLRKLGSNGDSDVFSDNSPVPTSAFICSSPGGFNNDNVNPATETDDNDNDDLDNADDCGPNLNNHQAGSKSAEAEEFVSHIWDDDVVQRGWTALEAGAMTVGELYLMLGQCERLCFEYNWENVEENEEQERATTYQMLDRLISMARMLKKKKTARSKSLSSSYSVTCMNCGHKNETSLHNNNCTLLSQQRPKVDSVATNVTASEINPSPGVPLFTTVSIPVISSPSLPLHSLTTSSTTYPVLAAKPATLRTVVMNPIVSVSRLDISLENSGLPNGTSDANPALTATTDTNAMGHSIANLAITSCPVVVANSLSAVSDSPAVVSGQTSTAVSCASTTPSSYASPNLEMDSSLVKVGTAVSVALHTLQDGETITSFKNKEPFQKPCVKILPASDTSSPEGKLTPPKPFVDLPKGNRRLGRKSHCKRVVIPRPLLPKGMTASVFLRPVLPITPVQVPLNPVVPGATATAVSLGASLIHISDAIMTTPTTEAPSSANSAPGQDVSHDAVNNPTHSFEMLSTRSQRIGNMLLEESLDELTTNSQSSSDFRSLMKSEGKQGVDIESNISLSSFMDVSLPESAKCFRSPLDKFLNSDFENSNSSLGLSKDSGRTSPRPKSFCFLNRSEDVLDTPKKATLDCFSNSRSPPSTQLLSLDSDQTPLLSLSDPQWMTADLSLSSLLNTLDNPERINNIAADSDVNFRTMLSEDLDYMKRNREIETPNFRK